MEVHENGQTIFGATGNHQSHRIVLKTERKRNIIIPNKLRNNVV